MPIKQEKPLWILLRSGYFYVQKMAKPLVNQGFSKKKISTADFINRAVEIWQGQKDLNPRHPVLETGVLPTELYPFIAVNYYNTYCRVLQAFFEKNLLYFYFLAFSPIFKAFYSL